MRITIPKKMEITGTRSPSEDQTNIPLHVQAALHDRSKEYGARTRGEDFGRLDYATPYEAQLSPLLCWKARSAERRGERIAELVRECDAEAAARREKTQERADRTARRPAATAAHAADDDQEVAGTALPRSDQKGTRGAV